MFTFRGEQFLTKSEAAARLGVSVRTLENRMADGSIAFRLYGERQARPVFSVADLDSYQARILGPRIVGGRPRVLRDPQPQITASV